MIKSFIPLVSYGNGIFMLAVFGLVCIGLVAAVLIFMFGGKKKESWEKPEIFHFNPFTSGNFHPKGLFCFLNKFSSLHLFQGIAIVVDIVF